MSGSDLKKNLHSIPDALSFMVLNVCYLYTLRDGSNIININDEVSPILASTEGVVVEPKQRSDSTASVSYFIKDILHVSIKQSKYL